MSIKTSNTYLISACASAFMLGYYTLGYMSSRQHPAASPRTVPDFDIVRFEEPWYEILMSNDLPFFTETCGQLQIKENSVGETWFYSRSYSISRDRYLEMDRQFLCSQWEPGKCAIEFIWEGYDLGAMHIVDTDYDNYAIRFSKATWAGIDYMEAIWVDAREPLEEGTQEHDDFVALITEKIAEYIPSFKMDRLSTIKQSTDCRYQLNDGGDPEGFMATDSPTDSF